jgi:serine/threonine protein kinase
MKMKEEDINYFEYSEFIKIEKIGEGGFGVVHKAETNDKKRVALKCLIEKENSEIDEKIIKDFIKEVIIVFISIVLCCRTYNKKINIMFLF